MRLRALISVLLFSSCCFAIEADQTRIEEYQLFTVTHQEGETIYATFNFVNENGTVERRVLDEKHFRRGQTETTFTGPPAMYEVTTGKPLFVEIVRSGQPNPSPTPKPTPGPDPIPGPTPDPNKIEVKRVFFIEEQNDRNINPQYIAFTNADFKKKLADDDVKVYAFDDDDPDKNVQDWVKLVGDKMPAAIFYGDGDNYRIKALPKDITADSLYSLYQEIAK